MKIQELTLGRSVKYPFYEIFALVKQRDGKPGLSIKLKKDRPAETKKSGIYVWHHPHWGYFYVGIAAADNFTERWNKHIQKLLDQCTSAKQMHNWREFATKFKTAGYGIDDLKDITLRFFPITTVAEFGGDKAQLKKELEALETRIISMINPACNSEYRSDKPSATKFPSAKPEVTESSGYIPRNAKEAQDPRWSSALTDDVHTDTMKKQIAKFFPTPAPKDGQQQVQQ